MFSDPNLLVTVVAEFVLMLLGAVVALHEDWGKKHHWWVLGAFLAIGLAAMLATIKTAERTAISESQLSTSVERLRKASEEIVRVENLNTELQQQLLKQSSAIVGLSQKNIFMATGGDSFCYFTLSSTGQTPTIVHQGEYGIYDVEARFENNDVPFVPSIDSMTRSTLRIGNLPPNTAQLVGGVKMPSSPTTLKSINIFFSARNGFWYENFLGLYVNRKWVEAIRVFRQSTEPRKKDVKIFERIDKDFPRGASGVLDWK